ncbi:MAG TPA: DUF1648 domain-containing protein [Verrucomicrobiae bacterium]|jgi:uncharacterized membrane protein
MRIRWPIIILLALAVSLVAQAAWYFPQMPERMASHFDASGAPNGWMSKHQFFSFLTGLTGVLMLVFVGLPVVLPKIPTSLINLPHKAYWLAAERRQTTLRFFGEWFLWQGCAMLAFVALVQELVYRANLGDSRHLDGRTWVAAAVFVVWTLGGVGLLLVKFRRVPSARPA